MVNISYFGSSRQTISCSRRPLLSRGPSTLLVSFCILVKRCHAAPKMDASSRRVGPDSSRTASTVGDVVEDVSETAAGPRVDVAPVSSDAAESNARGACSNGTGPHSTVGAGWAALGGSSGPRGVRTQNRRWKKTDLFFDDKDHSS